MTVILLHGPGLSSEVWETTETFKHLVDKGIQAFAIDMPGSTTLPRLLCFDSFRAFQKCWPTH